MAGLILEVKVTEIEPVVEILKATKELIAQIGINDYKDSLGHDIKNNKAYCELVEAVQKIKELND